MRSKSVWTYLSIGLLIAVFTGAIPINLDFKLGDTRINITTPRK